MPRIASCPMSQERGSWNESARSWTKSVKTVPLYGLGCLADRRVGLRNPVISIAKGLICRECDTTRATGA